MSSSLTIPGGASLPLADPDEVDLDGLCDARDSGVRYLGRAVRMAHGLHCGEYRALANCHGALCVVAVRISFGLSGDSSTVTVAPGPTDSTRGC